MINEERAKRGEIVEIRRKVISLYLPMMEERGHGKGE
jgi:hypothetical protein